MQYGAFSALVLHCLRLISLAWPGEEWMKKAGGIGNKGALFIVLASLAWSFAGVLSKWAPWSAYSIIGGRALIAAMFFGLSRKSFKPSLTKGNLIGAFAVVATSILFIIANKLTSAANAIVLQYVMPVVIILGYWVLRGQKPGRLDIAAILSVLLGVVLCFMGSLDGGSLLGDFLALCSAFTFALVFFAARRPDADPTDYAYLGNLVSILFLFYIPFDSAFTLRPAALLAVFLMGLCLSLGYVFFSAGMRTGIHPVTASILANVEPVMNPLWAFLFLGERLGPISLLGVALVLVSLSVYNVLKSKQAVRV